MKRIQNALWTGSVLGLLVGGWLVDAGPCRAQLGQPGQIQGGQFQGGFGVRTLPSVTGYLGSSPAGFTGTSPFGNPYNNPYNFNSVPNPYNFNSNPNPYNFNSNPNPYSFNSVPNPYNFNANNFNRNFNPVNPVPVPNQVPQQPWNNQWNPNFLNNNQFNNPWNFNPGMNLNGMYMGVPGLQGVGQINPFLQLGQIGGIGGGNNLAMNPNILAGGFGGFGGMGAGQVPGMAPVMGAAAGIGGFGGGFPFVVP